MLQQVKKEETEVSADGSDYFINSSSTQSAAIDSASSYGSYQDSVVQQIFTANDKSIEENSEEVALHLALKKIKKLKRKLSCKDMMLQEAADLRLTLRTRMEGLMKKAAELEKLRAEHAEAWQREKDFWVQEAESSRREALYWRNQAEQKQKALESKNELAKQSTSPEIAQHKEIQIQPLVQSAILTINEAKLKCCQRIIRSWLLRKRYKRFLSLVHAYIASPSARTQRRRFATIRELIQTERNYVDMLQHAVNHYMFNLREKAELEAETYFPEDIENLFNNMETLLVVSQQFLQALEQRYMTLDNFSCYGDIILKFQMVLPLYSVYYRKYEEINDLLIKLSENKEFTAHLEELQKTSKNPLVSLKVYLYRPCQRVPQYSLLLKQLLAYTPSEHKDYQNILDSADRVHKILQLMNRRTKAEQSRKRLMEIQNKLIGYDKNLTDDRMRQFVGEDQWLLLINVQRNEGNMSTRKIKGFKAFVWRPNEQVNPVPNVRARKVHVIVTSDTLLFVKNKDGYYRFEFSISLGGAVVAEMNSSELLSEDLDNLLMIKPKLGIERFFLFKDNIERKQWTERLVSMISLLTDEGKVKPEMRHRINCGRHMRLTHIGMTNLMKSALGYEGEDPLAMPLDDVASIYDLSGNPTSEITLSKDDIKGNLITSINSQTLIGAIPVPSPSSDQAAVGNSTNKKEEKQQESQQQKPGPPSWSTVQPRRSGSQLLALCGAGRPHQHTDTSKPLPETQTSSGTNKSATGSGTISSTSSIESHAQMSIAGSIAMASAASLSDRSQELQRDSVVPESNTTKDTKKLGNPPPKVESTQDCASDSPRKCNALTSNSNADDPDKSTQLSPSAQKRQSEADTRRRQRKLKREIKKLEITLQQGEDERSRRHRQDQERREHRQYEERHRKGESGNAKKGHINEPSLVRSSERKTKMNSPRNLESDNSSDEEIYDLKDIRRGSIHYDEVWDKRGSKERPAYRSPRAYDNEMYQYSNSSGRAKHNQDDNLVDTGHRKAGGKNIKYKVISSSNTAKAKSSRMFEDDSEEEYRLMEDCSPRDSRGKHGRQVKGERLISEHTTSDSLPCLPSVSSLLSLPGMSPTIGPRKLTRNNSFDEETLKRAQQLTPTIKSCRTKPIRERNQPKRSVSSQSLRKSLIDHSEKDRPSEKEQREAYARRAPITSEKRTVSSKKMQANSSSTTRKRLPTEIV